ncbi:hypothetical protein ACX0G9_03150 [Flavitalea flava]
MNIEIIEKILKELANESRETNNAFLGLQELVKSVAAKMYQFEVHLTNTINQQAIFERSLLEVIKDGKREREENKQIIAELQEKIVAMHLELLKELNRKQEEFKAALYQQQEEFKTAMDQQQVEYKEAMEQQQDDFREWLEGKQLIAPAVDLRPLADEMANGINNMNGVVKEGMADIHSSVKEEVAGINTSVNGAVTDGLTRVGQIVEGQPKAVIRQWRFLFYPESYQGESYRYLVRAVMIASVAIVLFFFLYSLGAMALHDHSKNSNGTGSAEKYQKMSYRDLADSINSFEKQVKNLKRGKN